MKYNKVKILLLFFTLFLGGCRLVWSTLSIEDYLEALSSPGTGGSGTGTNQPFLGYNYDRNGSTLSVTLSKSARLYGVLTNTGTTAVQNPAVYTPNKITLPGHSPQVIRRFRPPAPNPVLTADEKLRARLRKKEKEALEILARNIRRGARSPYSLNTSSVPSRAVAATVNQTSFYISGYRGNLDQDVTFNRSKTGTRDGITLTIWLEDGNPHGVTTAVIDEFFTAFLKAGQDNDIYDWITRVYGKPWGALPAGYNKWMIPETDKTNLNIVMADLGGNSSGGTLGFFISTDVYLKAVLQPRGRHGNEGLILYLNTAMLSPSNIGKWKDSLTVTIAHEFQHMIMFYQKTIKHNQAPKMAATWLNEMASVEAEDLVAQKLNLPGPGGITYPSGISSRVPSGRVIEYNRNYMKDDGLTVWGGKSLDYAVIYSFGAWLLRNYGGAGLFRNIVQSKSVDFDAVLQAVRKQAPVATRESLLKDWGRSVLLSRQTTNLPPGPYVYNKGGWISAREGFQVGSLNYLSDQGGRYGLSMSTLSTLPGTIPPGGQVYINLGRKTVSGTARTYTWKIAVASLDIALQVVADY